MPQVYVAAGSNLEPERRLTRALAELGRRFGRLQCSRWYRNRAVGFEGPDFINLVVGFETQLPPRAVQSQLREIESLCERPPGAPKWAPRAMDLDMLLYGDEICADPQLMLPRPDLLKRAYMLGPLAEIAPELRHPSAGTSIGELWARFDRSAHPLEPVPAGATSSRSGPRPRTAPDR